MGVVVSRSIPFRCGRASYSAIAVVLIAFSTLPAVAQTPRNVLLLISDNQDQADCGCYGHSVVKTPNIDRLAAAGTRFEYGFATTASCGPSRAVLYTGLHSHANGQYGHPHSYHNFRLMPKVATIFDMLHARGVHTGLLGKSHITTGPGAIEFQPKVNGYDVVGMAQAAGEFFDQTKGEPFFLALGYHDPHPTSRDRPGWGVRRDFDNPLSIAKYDPADVVVPHYLPDRPEVREGLAGYYQQITRVDHGIGLVLDALRKAGRLDETLVIFVSDHGSSEPGAMANHYEPGVRIPFIVKAPGKPPGVVSQAMVSMTDIVPTTLDWIGTPPPAKTKLHGRSLIPILDQPNPLGWDERLLSHCLHEVTMYYPMRTLRTRRYKLIWNIAWRLEYPLPIDTLQRATWTETLRLKAKLMGKRSVQKFLFRDEIELYDLQDDPYEVVNLAGDSKFRAVRAELSQKLMAELKRTGDPWLLRHELPMP